LWRVYIKVSVLVLDLVKRTENGKEEALIVIVVNYGGLKKEDEEEKEEK
jgi:hypothetical protein